MSTEYIELYNKIRSEIEQGYRSFKSKLPSIREMADLTGRSKTTVISAYEQLLAEGFIYTVPRKGYFVEDLDHVHIRNESPIFTQTPIKEKPWVVDLNQSSVDEGKFPHKEWRKCTNLALDRFDIQYGYWKGNPEFRTELQSYLYKSRGVIANVDQLIIGAGTQLILNSICSVLKFKHIGIEEPGYLGAKHVFQSQNITIQPIQLDEHGIDIDKIKPNNLDAIYVTPSHQYPTGKIMSVQRRQELLRLAETYQFYIIEDDYDSEFRLEGKPIPSLQSLDKNGRVIYLGTFSKAFLPSLRMGYFVIPKTCLHSFYSLRSWEQSCSEQIQLTMMYFMQRGYWEKHIRRMRKTYREKHDLVINQLKKCFGDKINLTSFKTGLRILIWFKSEASEDQFITTALEKGYRVRGTHSCWHEITNKASKEVQLLFGYGSLSLPQIEPTVSDLHRAWKHFL